MSDSFVAEISSYAAGYGLSSLSNSSLGAWIELNSTWVSGHSAALLFRVEWLLTPRADFCKTPSPPDKYLPGRQDSAGWLRVHSMFWCGRYVWQGGPSRFSIFSGRRMASMIHPVLYNYSKLYGKPGASKWLYCPMVNMMGFGGVEIAQQEQRLEIINEPTKTFSMRKKTRSPTSPSTGPKCSTHSTWRPWKTCARLFTDIKNDTSIRVVIMTGSRRESFHCRRRYRRTG